MVTPSEYLREQTCPPCSVSHLRGLTRLHVSPDRKAENDSNFLNEAIYDAVLHAEGRDAIWPEFSADIIDSNIERNSD
ncbi:unnamed protein product [Onchocerca flexuosa]|uniref:Uncharacterized protein n=1 Tax=Onchocerca flexuosa TaxID=387005 RepID=A0A183I104_9BILA|nr:unnamed protein product [Onchocerca flexuosa]